MIKSLPFQEAIDIPNILKTLGSAISKAVMLDLQRIVITWEFIPGNQFLFNGELLEFQAKATHHPMVDITLVEGMPTDMEKKLVQTIAENLSRELGIDYHNVCVVINRLPAGGLFVLGDFIRR